MKLFHRHNAAEVGDDEPVFLIRASDAEGPNLLRKYAFLLRARHPGAEELAGEIESFAETMFEWQHVEGNSAPPPEVAEILAAAEKAEHQGDEEGVSSGRPEGKPAAVDPQPAKGKPR